MEFAPILLATLFYVVAGRWIITRVSVESPLRVVAFLGLNLAIIAYLHCWLPRSLDFSASFALKVLGVYVGFVSLQWFFVTRWARAKNWRSWIPVVAPLIFLIAVKYVPPQINPALRLLASTIGPEESVIHGALWLGVSYMAFRLSYSSLELRRKSIETPTLLEFLCFAFFMPTLSVGPISSYERFQVSIRQPDPSAFPILRASHRILWGATKFTLLASWVHPLTFSTLLADGHLHGLFDLAVACCAYTIYLYLNFSGFCDIAVGLAALVGISVQENFNAPLSAANIQEFWNRWHITLGQYARDILFTPLSKTLLYRVKPQRAPYVIAVTSIIVFVIIGIWHGVGWNFALFGLMHGLGLAVYHLWSHHWKRRLGKRYRQWQQRPLPRLSAQLLTFCFVSASFAFFAMDLEQLRWVLGNLTS